MKVGFTGTRKGLTDSQQMNLCAYLAGGPKGIYDHSLINHPDWKITELHHGCCVGADEQAVEFAWRRGIHRPEIHGRPSTFEDLTSKPAVENSDVLYPAKYAPDRNRDIVDAVERLVACPEGMEEKFYKSGTWATIRYARKKDMDVTILYPDGLVQFTVKNPRPIVCWKQLS